MSINYFYWWGSEFKKKDIFGKISWNKKWVCAIMCMLYCYYEKIFVIVVMVRILLLFIQSSHWRKEIDQLDFYNILMLNGLWSYEFLSCRLFCMTPCFFLKLLILYCNNIIFQLLFYIFIHSHMPTLALFLIYGHPFH